jgi:hypothetical protein
MDALPPAQSSIHADWDLPISNPSSGMAPELMIGRCQDLARTGSSAVHSTNQAESGPNPRASGEVDWDRFYQQLGCLLVRQY